MLKRVSVNMALRCVKKNTRKTHDETKQPRLHSDWIAKPNKTKSMWLWAYARWFYTINLPLSSPQEKNMQYELLFHSYVFIMKGLYTKNTFRNALF